MAVRRKLTGVGYVLLLLCLPSCTGEDDVPDEQLVSLASEMDAARRHYAPEALAYLEAALDTLQAHHVFGPAYDWEELRLVTLEHSEGAKTVEEVYSGIRFALRDIDDPHTYFDPPQADSTTDRPEEQSARDGGESGRSRPARPLLNAHLLDTAVAYIDLYSFAATEMPMAEEYAETVQDAIRDMDARGSCGWIVDLRHNTGGNMWPMLAGLGPLVGAGEIGAFVNRDGERIPWSYIDGAVRMDTTVMAAVGAERFMPQDWFPPVAVLTSKHTASSGEAVVAAFRGRKNTRSFGHPTGGAATAHQGFQLRDGAWLGFSTLYYADRMGRVYDGPIEPDVEAQHDMSEDPDEPVTAARNWLQELPECRRKDPNP